MPLPYIPTKAHQAALYELGRVGRGTRHRRPADRPAPAATCCSGCRPASVNGSTRIFGGRARSDLEAAKRLGARARPHDAADPGPARLGQDLHRRADGPEAAERGQARRRSPASATRSSATCSTAVLDATEPGDVDVLPIQHAKPEQMLGTTLGVTRAKNAGDVRARLDDRTSQSRRGNGMAVGVAPRWSTRSTSCSSTRRARSRSPTSSPIARATDSLVLLGDPQQLNQPLNGSHPEGADRSALAHVLGARRHDAPDRGLFLEKTWRLHPDLCAFTSEVFYDGRLEPEGHSIVQRVERRRSLADGTGPRQLDIPTVGADNESPDEADAVAALARSIDRRGLHLGRSGRRHMPRRLERHLDRRPVQRPGRRDQATVCRPRRASERSTSSRVRRRRSASTR